MGGDSLGFVIEDWVGIFGYFVKKKNVVGVFSNGYVMGVINNRLFSLVKKDGGKNKDYIGKVNDIVIIIVVDCGYVMLWGRIIKFKFKDGMFVMGIEVVIVGIFIKFYGCILGLVVIGIV